MDAWHNTPDSAFGRIEAMGSKVDSKRFSGNDLMRVSFSVA